MVAIQVGCKRLNDFSFSNKTPSSTGNYELFTSCEPCAMCLGAILWSGVKMPEMQKLILFNLILNCFENSY